MKKNLFIIFFFLGLTNIFASDPVTIRGIWNRDLNKKDIKVKLFQILSGKLNEIASSQISDNNNFEFIFEPQDDGFYVIGTGSAISAQNKYIFYFKSNDCLNVIINDSSYVLTGKNTPENMALTRWHNEVSLLEYKAVYPTFRAGYVNNQSSTYIDFFPLLPQYMKKANDFRAETDNQSFETMFLKIRVFDILRYAYTFILTPRTVQPEKEDFTEFYTKPRLDQITATTDLLHYPFGVQLMQSILIVQGMPFETTNNPILSMVDLIRNDTLKGELVVNTAEKLKTYTDFLQFNEQYGKYILTNDQEQRINNLTVKLTQSDPALKTLDFSGTDTTDKKVFLSDFKGKVVVVDVWATWCGPCRKEIPALKTLEKEYHDKDIVFLSISLDEVKNKQKWMDFIRKEELTGVQLFGGNGLSSNVTQLYNIKGIPRFMVFGKNGNIVTDDAPRPHDPSLKNMIEEQLKKN